MIKSCRGQVNAFGREVTFAVYAEARNQGPSEMIYVSCTPKLLRPEEPRAWVTAGGLRGTMASISWARSDRGHRVSHYKRSRAGVGVAAAA